MTKEKVQKFIKHSVFDDVRHIGKWNEYEVWEPYFSDGVPRFLGFPSWRI